MIYTSFLESTNGGGKQNSVFSSSQYITQKSNSNRKNKYLNEGMEFIKRSIQESSVGVGFLGLSEGNL